MTETQNSRNVNVTYSLITPPLLWLQFKSDFFSLNISLLHLWSSWLSDYSDVKFVKRFLRKIPQFQTYVDHWFVTAHMKITNIQKRFVITAYMQIAKGARSHSQIADKF